MIKQREKEPGGDGLPPGHARIASPYDTDARWAARRDASSWLGYKVHITETCEDPPPCTCRPAADTGTREEEHARGCAHLVFPNLIINMTTTDATVTDNQMTEPVQDTLAARNPGPRPALHRLGLCQRCGPGAGQARAEPCAAGDGDGLAVHRGH